MTLKILMSNEFPIAVQSNKIQKDRKVLFFLQKFASDEL